MPFARSTRPGIAVSAALLVAFLAGCGGTTTTGNSPDGAPTTTTAAPDLTAADIANDVTAAVDSATKVVGVTEDTDGNNLLGRPGQYTSASVIYDEGAECLDGPGVDCGAVVEVFENEADATKRYDYVVEVTGSSPMFAEYDYRSGTAVLRVAGAVKPSVAKQYEAAFKSTT